MVSTRFVIPWLAALGAMGVVSVVTACSSGDTGSGSSGMGGSGSTGSAGTTSGGTGSGSTGSTGSTSGSGSPGAFSTQVIPIFQNSCASGGIACHGDPGVTSATPKRPYLGPQLGTVSTTVATTIWNGLMTKSNEATSLSLVTPNDATDSYLMHKLDDTENSDDCSKGDDSNTCGLLMPYTTGMLPQATRDTIRAWINGGAPNN